MRLRGRTVVTRLLVALDANDRLSVLIVTLPWPWITGRLAVTKSMVAKSIFDANRLVPGSGRAATKPRTRSFIRLMVLRYADVTAVSNDCPSFHPFQKKNIDGSGR
jgi:hypothetical protein